MEKETKYYTTENYLIKLYRNQKRQLAFHSQTIPEYERWKKSAREKLEEISGINQRQDCELSSERLSMEQRDGYKLEKFKIQTEPDVWMPLYVLIPDDIKKGENRPCIVAIHGHGGAGKESVAGIRDNKVVEERIDYYNYDYGLQMVRQGFVVFAADARGTGERREYLEQGEDDIAILKSSCYDLNNTAMSMGQSLMGMWIWDLMRLIDFIESLEYCNSSAIGCCGFSGGGLQALWLTALEDRIKATIISGYFHGFEDTILKTNLCGCNFVPNLWKYMDIGDIGSLIAPRPLLIESGREDPLNGKRGLDDVYEQVEKTKAAYELHDSLDNLTHYVFDGGHIWNGKRSIEFFEKFINV